MNVPQLFVHSSADGHLGSVQTSAIVNSAAVDTGCIHSFESAFQVSLAIFPEVRSLGQMAVPFFVFLRKLHAVLHSGCPAAFPAAVREALFSASSQHVCVDGLAAAVLTGVSGTAPFNLRLSGDWSAGSCMSSVGTSVQAPVPCFPGHPPSLFPGDSAASDDGHCSPPSPLVPPTCPPTAGRSEESPAHRLHAHGGPFLSNRRSQSRKRAKVSHFSQISVWSSGI